MHNAAEPMRRLNGTLLADYTVIEFFRSSAKRGPCRSGNAELCLVCKLEPSPWSIHERQWGAWPVRTPPIQQAQAFRVLCPHINLQRSANRVHARHAPHVAWPEWANRVPACPRRPFALQPHSQAYPSCTTDITGRPHNSAGPLTHATFIHGHGVTCQPDQGARQQQSKERMALHAPGRGAALVLHTCPRLPSRRLPLGSHLPPRHTHTHTRTHMPLLAACSPSRMQRTGVCRIQHN